MLGLKVNSKDGEQVKNFLIKKNLLDNDFLISKKGKYLIFPLTKKTTADLKENLKEPDSKPKSKMKKFLESNLKSKVHDFDVVEFNFKIRKKPSFNLLLKKRFPEDYRLIKKSYDAVGDIAILEIPRALESKEKLIAKIFLKTHNNIKTVLKKKGAHTGEFRIQSYELLAGKDKRETVYVENGCRFMLNVEKTYFSPRLSSERLRVAKSVKRGEDVLVMFSGYAPYPINIIKHSKPAVVYGVELNPDAHYYALINKSLNKIGDNKLILLNGDVNDVVPKIIEKRKPLIGTKAHWSDVQLKNRLKLRPKLIEFHLKTGDLEKYKKKVEQKIDFLAKRGIKVMIHQPFYFNNMPVCLSDKRLVDNTKICYKQLLEICLRHKNVIGFVIHPYKAKFSDTVQEDVFIDAMRNLMMLPYFKEKVFVENVYKGFFSKPEGILRVAKILKLRNLCFDFAHFYISNKDRKLIKPFIIKIKKEFNLYFHIADSDTKLRGPDKELDTLEVGKGELDFKKYIPLIDRGIVEVKSKNEETAEEAARSYKIIQKLALERARFDRIIMPLPKTGNLFLKLAFDSLRNKGRIHFYYFLYEKDIPKRGYEIIKKEAEKSGLHVYNKSYHICGQVGKRLYRVCFDFNILKEK